MLAIHITLSVILLLAIIVVSVLVGFIFRQGKLQKKSSQVFELEKEMLKNHAEIIDLYRQIDFLKNQHLKTGATILKLNDGSVDDEQEHLPDVSTRKKLLGKASNLK